MIEVEEAKIAHQICRDKEYRIIIMWSEDSAYLSQSLHVSEDCRQPVRSPMMPSESEIKKYFNSKEEPICSANEVSPMQSG